MNPHQNFTVLDETWPLGVFRHKLEQRIQGMLDEGWYLFGYDLIDSGIHKGSLRVLISFFADKPDAP